MRPVLLTKEVGPYSMNTYVIIDETTSKSAIIDPGGDPDEIMKMAAETQVEVILITHGHGDHTMALDEIKEITGAPVHIHPDDAAAFDIELDIPLADGDRITIGENCLIVIHAPGHTPGQCCFDLGDGRIIVGDTVFVGGPGRTLSPDDFNRTMETMGDIVFRWPDETMFFPGHGPSGTIGEERPCFESFKNRGWPADTDGDVTWE